MDQDQKVEGQGNDASETNESVLRTTLLKVLYEIAILCNTVENRISSNVI